MIRALFYCVAFTAIQLAHAQAVFTEYSVPTASSGPLNITPGPDGALWFTETRSGKICRITTSGNIMQYSFSVRLRPVAVLWGSLQDRWSAVVHRHRGRRDQPDVTSNAATIAVL